MPEAIGKMIQPNLHVIFKSVPLDENISNRESIGAKLLESLDRETEKWGVKVLRVEINRLEFFDK